MRIARLDDSVPARTLVLDNAPKPRPGRGELLIRVHGAGVTPTELQWYPTTHTKSGEKRARAIPGHEFSGVIVACGEDVSGLELGQEIFGMNDWFADGAMAEFCVASPAAVALKPPGLSHAQAASVPIGALTAWQGLVDRAKVQPGERVLVHGGAGAVGVFAIQVARIKGAHVIATASETNVAFVSGLGAEQVIDYRAARFEQAVTAVDAVFDTVGGETLQRSWGILKPQGRMVTIAASKENATDARTKEAFLLVEANAKQLTAIADLLEDGRLRPFVDAVVPLSLAPDAFADRVPRQGRGKVVVTAVDTN